MNPIPETERRAVVYDYDTGDFLQVVLAGNFRVNLSWTCNVSDAAHFRIEDARALRAMCDAHFGAAGVRTMPRFILRAPDGRSVA